MKYSDGKNNILINQLLNTPLMFFIYCSYYRACRAFVLPVTCAFLMLRVLEWTNPREHLDLAVDIPTMNLLPNA